MIVLRGAVAVFVLFVATAAQAVEPASDFYKGKQIRLISHAPPGGGYDAYARVMARHLPDHIPGRPTVVVENMPGANGLTATNYVYNAAPRDGTVIGSVSASIPTAKLLRAEGANFDVNKFSWLGNITRETFVGFVWHTAPAQTLEEAKTKEVVMGGVAVGAASVDYTILAKELFGYPFKLVTGYPGANEVKLAIEKGELQGTFATAYSDIRSTRAAWLKDNLIRIIVQHGFQKNPKLPGVPLFMDLAKTEADRQAVALLVSRQDLSKPYFAPPEVPADRLALLRRGFDDTMKDPAFLAETDKMGLEVDGPMSGEELAKVVASLSDTPSAVVDRVEGLLAKFQRK
jgi:tripartite-type tricarboxylate transporter receptor subunit TctC